MGHIDRCIDYPKVVENFGIKNFIETGTGVGDSLSYVIANSPSDMIFYTIELMEELYFEIIKKFGGKENVNLIKGYSDKEIAALMKEISDHPTLFWLYAHFPGADFNINNLNYDSEKNKDIGIPLQKELESIKNSNRDFTNDIIVMDDLRIYKDGPYEGGNWELRELCGADGNDFVKELFSDSHNLIESYPDQGYAILVPKKYSVDDFTKFVNGNFVVCENA